MKLLKESYKGLFEKDFPLSIVDYLKIDDACLPWKTPDDPCKEAVNR